MSRPSTVVAQQADVAKSRLEHVLAVGFSQMKVSGDSKQVKVVEMGSPLEAALTTGVAAKMLSSLPKTQDIEGKRGRDGNQLQGMNWASATVAAGNEVAFKDLLLEELKKNMEQFAVPGPKTIVVYDIYNRLKDMALNGAPAGDEYNPNLMLRYIDALDFFNQQIVDLSGGGITDKRFKDGWPVKVRRVEMSAVKMLQDVAKANPDPDSPEREAILTFYEHLNKFIFNYYVTVADKVDIYAYPDNSITRSLTDTILTMRGFAGIDEILAARTMNTFTPPGAR